MPSIRAALSLVLAALTFGASARAGDLSEALRAGDLARAETLLDQGRLTDSRDAAAGCALLMFDNRLAKARACLNQGLTVASNDKATWGALALTAFRRGDFSGAAQAYDRAGKPGRAAEARALAAAPAYRLVSAPAVYLVPLETVDPLPVIKVTLADGKAHLFVIDTGAAATVISPALAAALGVRPLPRDPADGADARVAILDHLALGGMAMDRTPALILDTSPFSDALGGSRVEGVIGVDLLRHFVVTLDYPHRRLRLRTLATEQVPAPGAVPFWIAGDHLLLGQGIVEGVPALTLIDTGQAGAGCALPPSTVEAIRRDATFGQDAGPAIDPNGGSVSALTVGFAGQIRIGTPCLMGDFPPPLEDGAGTHIGMLLTQPFLRDYAVTFDFRAMKMWLTPARAQAQALAPPPLPAARPALAPPPVKAKAPAKPAVKAAAKPKKTKAAAKPKKTKTKTKTKTKPAKKPAPGHKAKARAKPRHEA